jgi:hypothetical protein
MTMSAVDNTSSSPPVSQDIERPAITSTEEHVPRDDPATRQAKMYAPNPAPNNSSHQMGMILLIVAILLVVGGFYWYSTPTPDTSPSTATVQDRLRLQEKMADLQLQTAKENSAKQLQEMDAKKKVEAEQSRAQCEQNKPEHSVCILEPGGSKYTFKCVPQWTGGRCNLRADLCVQGPDKNAILNEENGTCACTPGYTGKTCTECAEDYVPIHSAPRDGPKTIEKCVKKTICEVQMNQNNIGGTCDPGRTHRLRNTTDRANKIPDFGAISFNQLLTSIQMRRLQGIEPCVARFFTGTNYSGCYWDITLPANESVLQSKTFAGTQTDMHASASSSIIGTKTQVDSEPSGTKACPAFVFGGKNGAIFEHSYIAVKNASEYYKLTHPFYKQNKYIDSIHRMRHGTHITKNLNSSCMSPCKAVSTGQETNGVCNYGKWQD